MILSHPCLLTGMCRVPLQGPGTDDYSMPMTNIPCCPIPMSPTAETEGWAYLEAMYHLNQIISQRLNPDSIAEATYSQIMENCAAVENIREKLLTPLRSKDACKSALDRLQHFAVRLHTAFIVSVCCRPALLGRGGTGLDPTQKKFLADRCKANLTETVRMFLAMHQLSVIPTRSWAFTYHGLSSAVLLGLLGDTKTDPEVRQLQGDLISALSATAAKEQTSPQPHIQKSDHDIELSGPLSRALTALKNIYDHGSVVGPGVKREGSISGPGSGTRTPLQFGNLSALSNGVANGQNGQPQGAGLDPHQNAALAMAELQQQQQGVAVAAGMPDFSGYVYTCLFRFQSLTVGSSMPFGQPLPHSGSMPDMAFDPASYMSPLDLYDSIFWGMLPNYSRLSSFQTNADVESPDPFNTGVDSMPFDFLAHPPPGQPQQQFYFP